MEQCFYNQALVIGGTMAFFNDIEMSNWKEYDIWTDSLWIIKERDKSGKHKNIYHGNFIPQIPNQLILRYTKANETIFEPFMGSGTTLFECENLDRKYIGLDINKDIVDYVDKSMNNDIDSKKYHIALCNSLDQDEVNKHIKFALGNYAQDKYQFVLMHPPYMDIIKFSDDKNDLSIISDISPFLKQLHKVVYNSLENLEKNRYFALVIGDIYRNSEVLPLSHYCMDMIKRNFKVKLKGIVVKNIEGNKGKLGSSNIWKYRALKSDYYIFKHEYIYVFKKEF